jgi:hypothetical protein
VGRTRGPASSPPPAAGRVTSTDAGWSSSVARWAHNPEVAGSNPAPATTRTRDRSFVAWPLPPRGGAVAVSGEAPEAVPGCLVHRRSPRSCPRPARAGRLGPPPIRGHHENLALVTLAMVFRTPRVSADCPLRGGRVRVRWSGATQSLHLVAPDPATSPFWGVAVRHISSVGPCVRVARSAQTRTAPSDGERCFDRRDGFPRAVTSAGGVLRSAAVLVPAAAGPDLDGAIRHAVVRGGVPAPDPAVASLPTAGRSGSRA